MQQKKRLTTPPSTRTCCWRSAAGAPQPWLSDDTCTLPRRKRSHHQYATREALSAGAGMQSALSRPGCNLGTPPPRAGRRANAARAPRPQTNTDCPERANGPKTQSRPQVRLRRRRLGAPGADRRAATNQRDCQGRPHGDAPRPHEDARGQGEDRGLGPGGHRGRGPHLLLRGVWHGHQGHRRPAGPPARGQQGAHREDDALQARPVRGGLRGRRRQPSAGAEQHVGLLDDGRHEGHGQGLRRVGQGQRPREAHQGRLLRQ